MYRESLPGPVPRQEVYQSWALLESNRILEPKKEKGGVGVSEARVKRLTSALTFLLFSSWLHAGVGGCTTPPVYSARARALHVRGLTLGGRCTARAAPRGRKTRTRASRCVYPNVRVKQPICEQNCLITAGQTRWAFGSIRQVISLRVYQQGSGLP